VELLLGRAPILGPLAAVLEMVHVRGGFDAHATLTARRAPRCIDHCEIA
jgi:hypothetical protein